MRDDGQSDHNLTHQRRTLHESAHKLLDTAHEDTAPSGAQRSGVRRSLNEAAHKLGDWQVRPTTLPNNASQSAVLAAASDDQRDVVAHASRVVLALGALGVVFGDIGTSPLYAMQFIFTQHADAARPSPAGVYGVVSLIFWSLTIIVSLYYAGIIMRAHNHGDGGIMALVALVMRRKMVRVGILVTLGVFGAGLFFGDGMITPAISVVSAVEGLNVATPALSHLVVPIALGILIALFALQRYGTSAVGWLFGPVMLIWFSVIGLLGLREVVSHPAILQALSPSWAVRFLAAHGSAAFLALGGVVLALTGAEALYADRGHFGATPIRRTWFGIVLPGVVLCYLGQGALIIADHKTITNPFYYLVPGGGRLVMVVLATAATVIASQAAVTGSFSVARQAVQLGFLPRLRITHTSRMEGQIYVPIINWVLGVGVAALVLIFRHSARLGDMYGVAVTGTFVLNTVLFIAIALAYWHTAWWKLVPLAFVLLTVELAFFASGLTKIGHGAWLPLCVGAVVATLMITWRRGQEIVTRNRTEQEGPLNEFMDGLKAMEPPIHRVPGAAIFLNPGKRTTPLALRAEVEHNHILHEKVVIVSIETFSVPHVGREDRFTAELLGHGLFKVTHLTVRCGYRDRQDIPHALGQARKQGLLERNLDLEHASYFLSRITITPAEGTEMSPLRKKLFVMMAHNAASPIDHFALPIDRTVVMGSQVSV